MCVCESVVCIAVCLGPDAACMTDLPQLIASGQKDQKKKEKQQQNQRKTIQNWATTTLSRGPSNGGRGNDAQQIKDARLE